MADRALVTVPVTEDLAQILADTEETIKDFGFPTYLGKNINDKDHYAMLVLKLEALYKAVLTAQISGPMVGPRPVGARFLLNSNGRLMSTLDDVAEYLHNDASNLLKHGDQSAFSMYEKSNVTWVLDQLKAVSGMLLYSIRQQVEKDMEAIQSSGASRLIETCRAVALIASGAKTDDVLA